MKKIEHPLIGIAGSFASGKDTVAHRLEKDFGYTHVSTSDIVREIALRERDSIERHILHEVAERHRRKDGAGVLVKHALKKPGPLVITGLRAVGEAKEIRNHGGILIFVDAPVELRYERMKARHRDNETQLSLEEFHANEQKEWHTGDADTDFNLRDIKAMSDLVVENTLDLEPFIQSIYKQLNL